ncbi:MAG TPA: asparaginase [Gemmatimonadales bacterium]
MNELLVEATRGGAVESVHPVSVAVTDADGRILADSRQPALVSFWRSAAKPFQAMPLVEDGAADHFQFGDEELALACASHSSEPAHLAVVDRMLERIGLTEDALACGPHEPLDPRVARDVIRQGTRLTPRWSNCSGKHAGMLAVALHHGWPTSGYEKRGHPLQERIERTVAAWTGVAPGELLHAVDGCTVVCFGLPLTGMATAYARFGARREPAAVRLRQAMMAHPDLIAGTGRYCTELMSAFPGQIVAKVGAEGVYSAALPAQGVGITLKVEDGDSRAAPVALHAVLCQLLPVLGVDVAPLAALAERGTVPTRNTRGEVTGDLRAAGALRFLV